MVDLGKSFIFLGIILIVVGVLLTFGGKIPGMGHLPGDIFIHRERFSFYFPLTTCVVISIIVTLILYFFKK